MLEFITLITTKLAPFHELNKLQVKQIIFLLHRNVISRA